MPLLERRLTYVKFLPEVSKIILGKYFLHILPKYLNELVNIGKVDIKYCPQHEGAYILSILPMNISQFHC